MNVAEAAAHQTQTLLQRTFKGLRLLIRPLLQQFHLGGTDVGSPGVQWMEDCIRCRDIWLLSENAKSYLQVLGYHGNGARGSEQLSHSRGHCGNPAASDLRRSKAARDSQSQQSPRTA